MREGESDSGREGGERRERRERKRKREREKERKRERERERESNCHQIVRGRREMRGGEKATRKGVCEQNTERNKEE